MHIRFLKKIAFVFALVSASVSASGFDCSYGCGQLGSEGIQKAEWDFIQILWQADKISNFLGKTSQAYMSKVFQNPSEVSFYYSKPEAVDSHWYRLMLTYDEDGEFRSAVRLLIHDGALECAPLPWWKCVCEKYDESCYTHSLGWFWEFEPIERGRDENGRVFIKSEFNSFYTCYDDEIDGDSLYYGFERKGSDSWSCPKTQYRFDRSVDFRQACQDIHDQIVWLRDNVHGLSKFPEKAKVKRISDKDFAQFENDLDALKRHYTGIFDRCATSHGAPSAFYSMALDHFNGGDHVRGLGCMKKVLEKVDLNTLEANLASQLCFSQGSMQNEVALYDQAFVSLKKAIEFKPQNKQAYFDMALVLFEQGKFEEAVKAYSDSGFGITPLDFKQVAIGDFSTGFTKGLVLGAGDGLKHFIPSVLSSIYGLGHGLWAFACDPKEVSLEMVDAGKSAYHFLQNHSKLETLQKVIPELQGLSKLGEDEYRQKGEIIGTVIGKYGIDFLTVLGGKKALSVSRKLRKANGEMTLHTLSKAKEAKKLQAVSQQWWEKTAPVINDIKAGNGKVGYELHKAFKSHRLSEVQTRRILHQAGFKTFARPKGIPNDAMVHLSKRGGGMTYVKAGTTDQQCILVRVMPGDPNSPNVMQRKPYVVQRVGDKAVKKDGSLVKWDSLEAHIPLEEFKFEGW